MDVYSSPEQPAKMVLYALSTTGNPYDPPTPLQELHSALDDRVLALRPKLPPPEVGIYIYHRLVEAVGRVGKFNVRRWDR